MAGMDVLLKRLVTTHINDFASWMLGCEVKHVEARPTEWLPDADPLRSDLLFEVTLVDNRIIMLHFEFQGRSSHKPMPRRMLKYITFAVDDYWGIPILSCIFYTGRNAGANDTGIHQVNDPAGNVILLWRYHVVHLWKMDAEELLALGRPGLVALIGQTIIRDSQKVLTQAITLIKQIKDPENQKTILTIMMVLITDEKLLREVQKMIEQEGLELDSAFMQLWQQKVLDAHEEGHEQGLQEGEIRMLYRVLERRFGTIPDTLREQLAQSTTTDIEALVDVALTVESLDVFMAQVRDA